MNDQTAYVEPIKHCTNEPTGTMANTEKRSNILKTVKNCQSSYVCKKCLVPTGCPRSLMLHLRHVHEENFKIFSCKFCSRYAARLRTSVYKHAMRKHRKQVLKHGSYVELLETFVNKDLSADNEASAGEDCGSKVQSTHSDQSESSISHAEQYTVMSSSSLGLRFLGKQHCPIDHDKYVCKLCGFSRVSSTLVVKHIWEDHEVELSELIPSEAAAGLTSNDVSITRILYKCDDCNYTTYAKFSLYTHCANHQFEGPSKCPHCSFCALSDLGIVNHVHKCHASGDLMAKSSDPKLETVCSKTAASSKATKRSKGRYKKQHARQHAKNWHARPYCSFKSQRHTSSYQHKLLHAHTELSTASRKRSAAESLSPGDHKVMKMDPCDAPVEISSSDHKAEAQNLATDSLSTSTPTKQNPYTCDMCLKTFRSLKYMRKHHKRVHLDLRRYQCTLCGYRFNDLHNTKKHIRSRHNGKTASAIKLPLEGAEKTIEAYRKQTGKCLNVKLYKRPLCDFRGNYLAGVWKHANIVHDNEKVEAISLTLEDSVKNSETCRKHEVSADAELSTAFRKVSSTDSVFPSSHKVMKMDTHDALKVSSYGSRAEEQKLPNVILSSATDLPQYKNIYRCDKCSARCKSLTAWYAHKQVHLDLRRYQCPLCGLRSNYLCSIRGHINTVHKGKKAYAIRLSVEDAKQTIEVYRKQSLSKPNQSFPYQCQHCGCRCSCLSNMHKHARIVHKGVKVQAILLTIEDPETCGKREVSADAELSSTAFRRSSSTDSVSLGSDKINVDTSDALEISSSDSRGEQQNPPSHKLSAATSTSRKNRAYMCDVCPVKCKTLSHWYIHKEVHADLRRYQCPLCGLRSNYSTSIQSHINSLHISEKAEVVRLSLEDAKQTIEAYRKQPPKQVKLDLKCYQCSLCGSRSNYLGNIQTHITTVHKGSKKAQAIKLSLDEAKQTIEAYEKQSVASSHATAAASCDNITSSSEQSSVQMQTKQQKIHTSDASHPHSGSEVPSLQICYACSVCKRQSNHKSPIVRHVRTVHFGRKARVLIVKRKMSLQQSELSAQNSHHDSKECANGSGVEVEKQNAVRCNMSENDDEELMPKPGLTDASDCVPAPAKTKGLRTHACDICPYSTVGLSQLINHRKLHIKRPGYSFACNVCPYFARQAVHLERHMQLHGKKPYQNSHIKASLHFCKHCPLFADRQSMLLRHRELHRPRAYASYKCEQCPYWVKHPHALRKHAKVHTAEYLQKRMEQLQSVQTASVHADVTDVDPEKHTVLPSPSSASANIKDLDRLVLENVSTADKVNEVTPNRLDDRDWNTSMVSGERMVAVTKENDDASALSNLTVASHQMPSWCCERCPYSTSKLAFFKRHMWLHGKQYRYICRYCDYSVQSYWQLVSHLLWHFAPNKHLVYAQSVSNLDSLPSELPNRNSIPDSLASVDRYVPSFENLHAFQLSDVASFRCSHCPFVTEQRSEFFSHMLCHNVRNAGHGCPYCTFHTNQPEWLSKHVVLHFNLPGCLQSSLPPNICHSEDWKQLNAAIKAIAETSTCVTELQRATMDSCKSWSFSHVELLKADALVSFKESIKPSDCEDDSVSVSTAVTQSAVFDAESLTDNTQHTIVTNPLVYGALSTDNMISAVTSKPKFCRYCDKVVDDSNTLVRHEAGHLIGLPLH